MANRKWILALLALAVPAAACQSIDVNMGKPRYATRTENLPPGSEGTGWEQAADNAERGSVRVVPAKPAYATRVEDLPNGQAPQAAAADYAASPASTRAPASSGRDPVIRREAIVTDELPPVADAATPERGLYDPPARPAERPAERTYSDTPAPAAYAPAPSASSPGASSFQYVVQSGDTVAGIGRRFGVPAQVLINLNGLEPRAAIQAGKALNLPATARERGSDPYATGPTPSGMRTGSPTQADASPVQRPVAPPTALAPALAPVPAPVSPPPVMVATAPPPSPSMAAAVSPANASVAASRGKGRFIWPVRGDILSRFGPMGTGVRNDGVNIAAPEGSPVKAAADGEVVYAGSVIAAFGNMVLIKHADGWVTAYGYMSRIDVHMRDRVRQGQIIGAVGATGGVERPQLHFEIRFAPTPREKAAAVDPLPILR